jgi:hypothetical protein
VQHPSECVEIDGQLQRPFFAYPAVKCPSHTMMFFYQQSGKRAASNKLSTVPANGPLILYTYEYKRPQYTTEEPDEVLIQYLPTCGGGTNGLLPLDCFAIQE